ncbi:uncharacterized protein TrAtP1_005660 [Trichoderma atroviride]|uniref:uncharacterized protein n=1 Tax=Hypocrea atroviridis TaxID=63577 RepID=UPI0033345C92|nr:hypothetical protein TrAtP1_005660 [Trichoderma atroviride]
MACFGSVHASLGLSGREKYSSGIVENMTPEVERKERKSKGLHHRHPQLSRCSWPLALSPAQSSLLNTIAKNKPIRTTQRIIHFKSMSTYTSTCIYPQLD